MKNEKNELLRMQNVSVYHAESALRHFHLRVFEGEMIELLGVSGSGKTALYEYLCGTLPAEEGIVSFLDMSMKPGSCFRAAKEVICIGANSTLVPGLTIAENISIITSKRKYRGIIPKKAIYYRVNLLLGQYIRELRAEQYARELTPVQGHLVELLRAVENEAKMVYIDDIFAHYGSADMIRMQSILELLKERGITILVAQRGKPAFQLITDRVIVLRDGENVRTFYKDDYQLALCQMWMMGHAQTERSVRKSHASSEVIFQMQNLSGPKYLTKVNMDLHRGELIGFYDMNNYANIELAELLVGETQPESGHMMLNGSVYTPGGIDSAIHSNIGYFPASRKDCKVVESMDYADNLHLAVMLKMSWLGIFENHRVKKYLANEYKDKLYLEESRGKNTYDLYSKTSIMFRKWILSRPCLLICEDILDDMDTRMQKIVLDSLNELTEEGCTVVITSQKLGELKAVCDTIYIMNSLEAGEKVSEILRVKNITPF